MGTQAEEEGGRNARHICSFLRTQNQNIRQNITRKREWKDLLCFRHALCHHGTLDWLRYGYKSAVDMSNQWRTEAQIIRVSSPHLSGLVVRVLGYRSRGPGSIPGATTFSEK
jgi:hypothetical protein